MQGCREKSIILDNVSFLMYVIFLWVIWAFFCSELVTLMHVHARHTVHDLG